MGISLDELFAYADIDDVTNENDHVELVFTMRNATAQPFEVAGSDLEDALDQARRIVARERKLDDLRRNGLTDEDIERLAGLDANEFWRIADERDDAWFRGFQAGAQDIVDALIENGLIKDEATQAAPFLVPTTSAPAMAAAAEPVTSDALRIPDDVKVSLSGKEIPISLALLMPGRIVID